MAVQGTVLVYAFVYKWLSWEERSVGNLAGGGRVREWYIMIIWNLQDFVILWNMILIA